MLQLVIPPSTAADLPVDAHGVYVAAFSDAAWSVELGRRWVSVNSDGARVIARYRVDELGGGTRITTFPRAKDDGASETWWLVTGGDKRYLVRDVSRLDFCLALATGNEPRHEAFGAAPQQETGLTARWSPPTGPDWLLACAVPEHPRWTGIVVPRAPGDVTSVDVVFEVPVTDNLFVPYGGAVCGIDAEDAFVTLAVGGRIHHEPTVLAQARMLTPHLVGTVVELHGAELGCPEDAE